MKCRIETAYNGQNRNIESVLMYEILYLHNNDIFDTLVQNKRLSKHIRTTMKECSNQIKRTGLLQNTKAQIHVLISKLIFELNQIYKSDIKYCLWLADEKDVVQLYARENQTETISYYNESNIVLSDLGQIGVLYAYNDDPTPIKEKVIFNA